MRTPSIRFTPACWLGPIALAASVAPASATPFVEPIYWHMNGSACTPKDVTAQEGLYQTLPGGGVGYRESSTTHNLVFICPVTTINDTNPGHRVTPNLRMFYRDPDGSVGSYQVRATMKSYALQDGSYNNNVCRINSNLSGTWQSQATPCAVDLGTHLYWVEVVMARSEPGPLPLQFQGVELVGL